MNQSPTNRKSTALLSAILCLPFAIFFTLILANIEPDFGPLQPLLTNPDPDQPNVLGSLIALITFILVIAAFVINLIQIARTLRSGGKLISNPASLVFAVTTLAAIVFVIGSVIVDQYPCWTGVPNCD